MQNRRGRLGGLCVDSLSGTTRSGGNVVRRRCCLKQVHNGDPHQDNQLLTITVGSMDDKLFNIPRCIQSKMNPLAGLSDKAFICMERFDEPVTRAGYEKRERRCPRSLALRSLCVSPFLKCENLNTNHRCQTKPLKLGIGLHERILGSCFRKGNATAKYKTASLYDLEL